jgi:class 3 adenylate cyclase/predicted ATPase
MDFYEVLDQVVALLRTRGRVTYRALKLQFQLDDEHLEALKEEIIEAQRVASDEDGKVLVWAGKGINGEKDKRINGETAKRAKGEREPKGKKGKKGKGEKEKDFGLRTSDSGLTSAERRQLTVLFGDLVDSTTLSALLDPEEYREVVRAYHETCAGVISRYGGHTAQHLGDGLLVYFSYPAAHEDDAQRAVRTGLEILAGLQSLNAQLSPTIKARLPHPIQLRIGIHTGLVVVGEIGSTDKREILALGETPNIAARLQALAQPDTVVISAVTARLVQNVFTLEELGTPQLKGVTEPLAVARVLGLRESQGAEEETPRAGVPFLVGRDEEVGLLRRRWEQSKERLGQVVLITGEPGIGKTALVATLRAEVRREGATRLTFRCSPYHQNSALYPVIEHLQRMLQFQRDDASEEKLRKLEDSLAHYSFALKETVPLFASLLSLPASRFPLPVLTPQQQKQQTHDALAAWLMEETERQAVLAVWEDLQWADPSTLEMLGLVIDQTPTVRMLTALTFRPDFTPPWPTRSHMTPLTLNRLERPQVEALVKHLAGGKVLPTEVLQQIVSKTDGVPLFVEELTKMVLESNLLRPVNGHYELSGPLPSLAIPATLQDSLMARLDRLSEVREVVQLGAVLGREFAYEMLRLLTVIDDATLQARLAQLVAAELLYQRGRPPRARYIFKHALIQDAAYASMLKSTRQRAHQQVAQVFVQHFAELVETQPEVVAYHYTEAGLTEQAIPYWQKAGQRATQRSANVEAISHLTKGLELLKTLPDTPERTQQELTLQIALGVTLQATKGYGAPEVETVYTRARELCRRVGETSLLFPVLPGLWKFYVTRAEFQTVHELGEQLLTLAQRVQDPVLLLEAHCALGNASFWLGEVASAQAHLEQGVALYDLQQHRSLAFLYGDDPGVICLSYAACALWSLGYPEQALRRSHEALTLARELSYPSSLAFALSWAAMLHQYRQEGQVTQERAEAAITLCTEQGLPYWLAMGTILRGWALTEQGQGEKGIAQMHQGLAALRATGTELRRPYYLALLAEAYGKAGQAEEGLRLLGEALGVAHTHRELYYEAEIHRLRGELSLQSEVRSPKSEAKTSLGQVSDKSQASQDQSEDTDPRPLAPDPHAEAEACFHKAIEVAREQQAKSLELRATISLARLWQQQGKQYEAHNTLSEVYGWFTEGFDTKDLQEAKALLEELT